MLMLMLTRLPGPAQDVSFGFHFYLGGPGVIAIFAEEFALETTKRREDSRYPTPQKMPAELRKLNSRRAAFRADDGMPKRTVLGVPLLNQLTGLRTPAFLNSQPDPGQGRRKEIPFLQVSFAVNFRLESSFSKATAERLCPFRFVESSHSQPFHTKPFLVTSTPRSAQGVNITLHEFRRNASEFNDE